eukprot:g6352.t1
MASNAEIIAYYYRNSIGEEFGPFHPAQMDTWLINGAIDDSLEVRAADEPEGAFVAICKRGSDPFRVGAIKERALSRESRDDEEEEEEEFESSSDDNEETENNFEHDDDVIDVNDEDYDDEDDTDVVNEKVQSSSSKGNSAERASARVFERRASSAKFIADALGPSSGELSVEEVEDIRKWVALEGWKTSKQSEAHPEIEVITKRVYQSTGYYLEGCLIEDKDKRNTVSNRSTNNVLERKNSKNRRAKMKEGLGEAPRNSEIKAAAAALSLREAAEEKQSMQLKQWETPVVLKWLRRNSIEKLTAEAVGFRRTIKDLSAFLESPNAPPTEVFPNVYIGHEGNARDLDWIKANKIRAVLNLCSDECGTTASTYDSVSFDKAKKSNGDMTDSTPSSSSSVFAKGGLEYLPMNTRNDLDFDLYPVFASAHNFINRHTCKGHNVLVHCYDGISVSPTVVMAHIMRKMHSNVRDVANYTWQRRRVIEPNLAQLAALIRYETELAQKKENGAATSTTNTTTAAAGNGKKRFTDYAAETGSRFLGHLRNFGLRTNSK